jgi:excisionase family DNA binding protein
MQVTIKDAARILNVSLLTTRKWADSGKIPSFRMKIGQLEMRVFDSEQLKTIAAKLPKKRGSGLAVFKEKDRRYKENQD